ncbi:MAG TPA: hypothetical protein VEO96_08720 [Thermoplasmata archaeon]|nr:hypothetical protein [Thermoplasmata archaeon]
MDRPDEIRHLRDGPKANQQRPMIDHIIARCPGNAEVVLRRCKQVLDTILAQDPTNWPSNEVWHSVLPKWFVAKCAPEMTREAAENHLRQRQGLSPDERQRIAREEDSRWRWSVLNTVFWFRPEERSWWWWDGVAENENTIRVAVAIGGWPYASGALRWILRASGATSAENEV